MLIGTIRRSARRRPPQRELLDTEQIAIAQRMIALRQTGKLNGVWVDRGVVRVSVPTKAAGPAVRRMISWHEAARMVERLEGVR